MESTLLLSGLWPAHDQHHRIRRNAAGPVNDWHGAGLTWAAALRA